jgi:hypothetical protein
VAAAKKKSWDRKKGNAPDTLTQLKMEEGVEGLSDSEPDKSLFAIWNKDGTAASTPSSLNSTPTGSPVVSRKSTVNTADNSASNSRPHTPVVTRKNRFSSIRGKRMSVNLSSPPKEEEDGRSAFPGLSMRSADAAAFQQLKRESEAAAEQAEQPAFPGMSLRSSDAAAFQELLKMDKEKKDLNTSSGTLTTSLGSSPQQQGTGASSPSSPVNLPDAPAASGKRGSDRRKPDVGLKLSFVGQGRRGSQREMEGAGANPGATPQRSPKSNKRFSTVFSRQPLSPKGLHLCFPPVFFFDSI